VNGTRRRLQAIGMAALLATGGAYAIASWDWCGDWKQAPARLVSSARATGALKAGAASVAVDPPWPVTVAGYGPMRPSATRANHPLQARALVLQVGDVTAAVVALDLLLVPEPVVEEIRARSGLTDAWVIATHSHSSLGGYDQRPLAELAGTGWYREAAKNALVRSAVEALALAQRNLAPAQLATGAVDARLCRARSGPTCDGRLSRMTLWTQAGAIAEWVVVGAHPTLMPRKLEALDPDYPGAFAERRLAADAGIVLVSQGSGGNASAPEGVTPSSFAERLEGALPEVTPMEQPLELAIARTRVSLPRPDANRLVPALSRMPANNFICLSAAREAEVAMLRLGSMVWLAAPVEASQQTGARLEAAAGATRLVSLANGYLGYLEPPEVVASAEGESKRQYYGAAMLERLEEAARLSADAVK
jgi:neutral ceramidase